MKKMQFNYDYKKPEKDYMQEFNEKVNRIIAEEVQKKLKYGNELIDFLLKDNTKRYALTRIFGTALAVSFIINLILIYFLIK